MTKLTLTPIEQQLNEFNGAQIIGIDTVTTVRVRTGSGLKGRLKKITRGSKVMVFKSSVGFKNMVNRRLEQQIDTTDDLIDQICGRHFEPGPRPWGHRIPNTPFVEHKGQRYLECIFLSPGKSEYYVDKKRVEKSTIEHAIPPKKEGRQEGLRDKVIIRTYKMDSILKVRKRQTEFVGEGVTNLP